MLPRINAVNNNVTIDRLNSDRAANIPSIEPEDRVILSQEALRNEGMMPITERVTSDKPHVQAKLDQIYERDENLTHLKIIGYNHLIELRSEDIVLIAKALQSNPHITSLNVCRNYIGAEGAKALAKNKTLEHLYVSNNNIGDQGAKDLAKNKTLKRLDVSNNIIGDQGAKDLAKNKTLTHLRADDNDIGAEGAKDLAKNKTLTHLNAHNNNIGAEGAKALAASRTLTYLDVYGNNIGPDQVRLLGDIISQNRERMEALSLSVVNTPISDEENPLAGTKLTSKDYLNAKQYQEALVSYMLHKASEDLQYASQLKNRFGDNADTNRAVLTDQLRLTVLDRDPRFLEYAGISKKGIFIADIATIISSFLKPSDIDHRTPPTPAAQSRNDRGR
ncbi:MAG: hypothetical protein V4485_01815 [Pseudomonadota bacterium]